jgi:galactoside O-acetyltransferase
MGKFAIIGANSAILPNVIIGEGVTVSAGSIITKDLEPWEIYIGNRRIGWHHKEEVLKNYEKFKFLPKYERVGTLFQNNI